MPTDTKVQTPRVNALSDKVEERCKSAGNNTDRLVLRGRYLVDALLLGAELERQLTARTAELEEARKQLAAANAKVLELAQQLHREQGRASRANPFVDRD